MPLTKSGNAILRKMQMSYGRKNGKSVLYASMNMNKKGTSKWHMKDYKGKKK